MPDKLPPTRQDDVVDDLHGVMVADPYRWLENGDSEETQSWVAAQNRLTESALGRVPQRAAIHASLDRLLTTGSVSAPVVRGNRYFYQRRDGRLDQPVLVVREGETGGERTIVDP